MPYSISFTESVKEAEEAIHEDRLKEAIAIYEKLIKRKPSYEKGYSRLMMLYRRIKEYRKELQVINAAIKNITEAFHTNGRELFGKNNSVKRISNALMKSLGLKTSQGKNTYEPEQVIKWRKRKAIVLKKLSAK